MALGKTKLGPYEITGPLGAGAVDDCENDSQVLLNHLVGS